MQHKHSNLILKSLFYLQFIIFFYLTLFFNVYVAIASTCNQISTLNQNSNIDLTIKDFIKIYKTSTPQLKEITKRNLRKKLKETPADAETSSLLGFAYFIDQEYKQAQKFLSLAHTFFPNSLEINLSLAKCYTILSKSELAYPLYHTVLKLDPNNVEALFYCAIGELNNENYDNAIKLLQNLINISPLHRDALLLLSRLLVNHNRPNEAISHLHRLIQIDKNQAEIYWLLGKAYQMTSKPELAVKFYEQAQNLKYKPSTTQEEYNYAKALKDSGKYEDAIKEYKKAIKTSSDKFTGYFEVAEIYEELGNLDAAIKFYLKAYNENPKILEPMLRIAQIYKSQNKLQEAETILAAIKKKKYLNEEASEILSEIYEKQRDNYISQLLEIAEHGNDQQKIEVYTKIIEHDKSNKEAYYKLIEILEKIEDFKTLKYIYKLMYKNKIISEYELKSIMNELDQQIIIKTQKFKNSKISNKTNKNKAKKESN